MGLFSRSKTIGTLTIQFADKHAASVTTANGGEWATDIKLFCWYYARILNNLRNCGDTAPCLLGFIDKVVQRVISGTDDTDLIPGDITLLPAAPESPRFICVGILSQHSNGLTTMHTEFGHGDEEYFAPVSVLILHHHTIENLDPSTQPLFWASLAGMHNYYREYGWTRIPSINEAPNAGLKLAHDSAMPYAR